MPSFPQQQTTTQWPHLCSILSPWTTSKDLFHSSEALRWQQLKSWTNIPNISCLNSPPSLFLHIWSPVPHLHTPVWRAHTSTPPTQHYYPTVSARMRIRTINRTITHMMIIIFFCGEKKKKNRITNLTMGVCVFFGGINCPFKTDNNSTLHLQLLGKLTFFNTFKYM